MLLKEDFSQPDLPREMADCFGKGLKGLLTEKGSRGETYET